MMLKVFMEIFGHVEALRDEHVGQVGHVQLV